MNNFFTDNKDLIFRFIVFSENNSELKIIVNFLRDIVRNSKNFDKNCQFNINNIGDSFIYAINPKNYNNKKIDKELIEDIVIFLIRVAKEYELKSKLAIVPTGKSLLKKYENESTEFSIELNEQIYYTFKVMPFDIMQEIDRDNKSNIEKESSLKVQLENMNNQIKDLKEQSFENRKDRIHLDELKREQTKLEEELETLKAFELKVEEMIEYIVNVPQSHINKLIDKLEKRIKFFNTIGFSSLLLTAIIFFLYICSIFCKVPITINIPDSSVAYFNNVFFIVFPSIVAFASFRQSNLKSIELEKLNEKLLISNYLIASIRIIQKMSKDSDISAKVLDLVNRFMNSILNNGNNSKNDDKEEKSLTASEISTILKNVTSVTK